MKEILDKSLFANTEFPESRVNNRRMLIIIISLLGAWIISFPYEGQLLYTLAKNYGIESSGLLDISLAMQVVGLISGGIFIKTLKAARKIIICAIPVCILCTVTFFFPSYEVWLVTLTLCSALAGICIAAFGYFIKNFVTPDNRFRTAAELLINMNILKMLINNISLYVSIQTGFAFTILMLGAAWYLTFKIPFIKDERTDIRVFDRKTGLNVLILLFLFVFFIAINFGISIETINPHFEYLGWLTNWYWLLPYLGTAFIIRSLKNTDDRRNMLYIALGMTGLSFILFLALNHSVISYLLINTATEAGCAVCDIFWYSILFEMLEMGKSPAKILCVGFSAIMTGVLFGKIIAKNYPTISGVDLSIVSMAVICITLFIIPVLHKLLSKMIRKNAIADTAETNIIELPDCIDTLTEREKQIAALLLKGRTCKLIAAELYLSENTVKTHIRNIYSKLGVKRKSELFKFMTE